LTAVYAAEIAAARAMLARIEAAKNYADQAIDAAPECPRQPDCSRNDPQVAIAFNRLQKPGPIEPSGVCPQPRAG